MLKSLRGTNALTVFLSPSVEEQKTRMFFCPYRKNIVGSYQGQVSMIYPGYNPRVNPQFFVRPQRQSHDDNINYIFSQSENNSLSAVFWLQDQYFDYSRVKTYHCYNCQAPQLFFDESKVVLASNKKEIKPQDEFNCSNCGQLLTYMGIVKIREPKMEVENG